MRNIRYLAAGFIAAAFFAGAALADFADYPLMRGPEDRLWEPIPDEVYLQEKGRQIETDEPVNAVLFYDGELYAAMSGGIYVESGGNLQRIPGSPTGVERMVAAGGAAWVMADSGLYRYDGSDLSLVDSRNFVDVTEHLGDVVVATRTDLYRYENGNLISLEPEGGYEDPGITFRKQDFSLHLPRPIDFGNLRRIASYHETIYGLRPGNLVLFDGLNIDPNTADWGLLPRTGNTRDMLVQGSRLYVTTDRGLAVLRGMAWDVITGEDGLPYEDTTCLAHGFEDDLWIGTTTGAVRKVGDEFHYFGAYHWLPGDGVRDITVSGDTVYIATDHGLGIIEYIPFTLRKKADYYEQVLEAYGQKRMGFTHLLQRSGDEGWIREITDNDGGYTAHYLVAMTYKYAVTGDEAAREEAVNTFKALAWLEEITPMRGFPARAIWAIGETGIRSEHASGGWPAEWHDTPDGNFQWKGDTSSDETGAHYYATAIFHDIAARGEEKERAAEHIRRMTDHIVENGWKLQDVDGSTTRWGRWDPGYLFHPYGQYAQGLNGMEAQSYAQTAWGVTGEDKYADAMQELLDLRYHEYTVQQKRVFPPNYIVPWDDRLAFMAYYPLIKYTEDPRLRSIYARSLGRAWEVKRFEQYAWYNFLYGILTGNDCEADVAVQYLREYPLDTLNHRFRNSHRHDLHTPDGYQRLVEGERAESPKALSRRETMATKLDQNTLFLDGGGNRRPTPNEWLETYWMGRFFGLIEAPDTDDPALLEAELEVDEALVAPPYEGPDRPEGLLSID